jgi:hypothetical protein
MAVVVSGCSSGAFVDGLGMEIFIILLFLFGEIKKTYKKNECLVLYYRTMNSRTEKMLMATSTELFIFISIWPTTHLHHRII